MTAYLLSELAAKALREPGLYGPDETISADDQADAEVKAQSLTSTLSARGVALWNGSYASVPEEYFIPLAQFVALYLMPSFGGSFPTKDQISGAESVLRELSATAATGSVAENQYY